MKTKYTLIEFLKNNKIVIPKIQRDYVQGINNSRNNAVRLEFLKDIKQKFEANEEMNLDFIYGSFKDGNFTPLDGQQRLTTLFLLHWFAKNDCDDLKKFSFEVRPYSKEFVSKLTNSKIDLENENIISKNIENQPWFLSYWKKDTTVNAMLTMLDDIQNEFNNQKNELSKWLTEKVTFYVLKLENYKLSDELYIKMNARGKALSDYENFKSWIDEKIPETYKSQWIENIDKTWTDLVWSYDDGDYNIDNEMMVLFRTLIMFHLNEFGKELEDLDKYYKLLHGQTENGTGEKSFISLKEYDSFIGSELISFIENTSKFLNKFSENKEEIEKAFEEVDFWDKINNPFKSLMLKNTLKNKVMFFTIYQYMLKDKFEISNFKKYLRIIRNLVEYTNIGFIDLNKYFDSIKYLARIDDLFSSEIEVEKITGFNKTQVEEEIKKISLVKKNILSDEKIIEAENDSFLKGQISFLINIEPIKEEYLEKIKIHFDSTGVKEKYRVENIFLRNFISKFNNWDQLWHIPFNNKYENWKQILLNKKYKDILVELLNNEEEENWLNNNNSTFSNNNRDGNYKLNQKLVHEDLYKMNVISCINDCFLKYSNGQYYIAPYNAKAGWNRIIIGNKRNEILSQLLNENIKCEQKYEDINFFWGSNITIKYNEKEFVWKYDDKINFKGKEFLTDNINSVEDLLQSLNL
jgi:hypothetical protein